MWNINKASQLMETRYPIIQAGMAGGVTTPELAATVSNSGALGMIGAGYMTPEVLEEAVIQVKDRTDQSFGVNLFIPEIPAIMAEEVEKANTILKPFHEELDVEPTEVKLPTKENFEKQVELVLQHDIKVCSFTFGVPSKELIHELKKNNTLVIGTATTVEEACINEDQGVDIVVAQGSEAGGHRGTFVNEFDKAMIGTMSLVPQIVDHVTIPVIAAGGIMDGRGVLASLSLGAQGVQMGTAFVTTKESGAKKQHKDAILQTNEAETVMTSSFSGKPARGINNQFIRKMRKYENQLPSYPIQNSLTKVIRSEAAKQNRSEYMSLWSGQSPRLSRDISAEELIESIVSQVNHSLHNIRQL
ncbi:nitronate monooxygenase [Halobacillus sp. A1]|uniref:NAD(P)H-dependent flavin oxidoreductase n=1 Tax=Halobacillus sp. A1 TaxID=2880262 RepID=UPI0020A660EF|nr:nitronate monooxygenase [Halobacillus sp. A1]MCP3032046.1 nitronate monooxygenase [Halobacillus sp. A1]